MERTSVSWTHVLEAEDWQFLRRFLVASGSLKALAEEYGISYPTVRNRLNRLIAKVRAAEEPGAQDAFHRQLRVWVAEGRLDHGMAQRLLAAHQETLRNQGPDGRKARVSTEDHAGQGRIGL